VRSIAAPKKSQSNPVALGGGVQEGGGSPIGRKRKIFREGGRIMGEVGLEARVVKCVWGEKKTEGAE